MLRKLSKKQIILLVGFLTFFFGFGAGAILNLYLLVIKAPIVLHFRSSLTFISSILGDGIILPIINMLAASFLLENKEFATKRSLLIGLIIGLLITICFHVAQGVERLTNWSMPTPWHWNFLGIWHATYMLIVASLLPFYFIAAINYIRKNRRINKEFMFVGIGLITFFMLLKYDYAFLFH